MKAKKVITKNNFSKQIENDKAEDNSDIDELREDFPKTFSFFKSEQKNTTTEYDEENEKLKKTIKDRKLKLKKKQLKQQKPDEKKDKKYDFFDLGITRPFLKALNDMDICEPTPIQKEAIPFVFKKRDVFGCATTGTGKTAAFMLPILEDLIKNPLDSQAIQVLVLAPTRELAIQVHDIIVKLCKFAPSISSVCLTGGLDLTEQGSDLRKMPDIVIATPGRLLGHLKKTPSFSLDEIRTLIIDEADRMLDEKFIDQLKDILRHCPKERQTMLFSATLNEKVEEIAQLSLKKPKKIFVNSNDEVTINLCQEFIKLRSDKPLVREAALAVLVVRSFPKNTCVFLNSKRVLKKLSETLKLLGVRVQDLHGDMKQKNRLAALNRFKNGGADVILTTDLLARGLDIERIQTVINFHMPINLEDYIHRVGRTARAGRVGRSISLIGNKERDVIKEIVKRSKYPLLERIIEPPLMTYYLAKLVELKPQITANFKDETCNEEIDELQKQIDAIENFVNKSAKERSQENKDRLSDNIDSLSNKKRMKLKKMNNKLAKSENKEDSDGKPNKFRKSNSKGLKRKRDFHDELTDVSQKNVKKFRYEGNKPKVFGKKNRAPKAKANKSK